MARHHFITKTLSYLFLIVASFGMIYPVLYMMLGAFTTEEQFFRSGFLPIPNLLSWQRVGWALDLVQGAYLVTLLRTAFYVGVTLLVGVVAGYIFSKLRFPGRERLFLLLLSGMVMPAILMIVPQYVLAARWPLAGGNDLWGQGGHGFAGEWPVLFMYGWVPPFAIFLMKQNFDMLPNDYEDAARIDGAGLFTIIFRIYGPMLKPSAAALTIVTFLTMWNDYLWPSVAIVSQPAWYPISYQIGSLVNSTNMGSLPGPETFLILLTALWPPALVYFLLQRYFVQGLVASGLKG